jgi:uncharacterized membrane protein YkvA (DUF1232 family)
VDKGLCPADSGHDGPVCCKNILAKIITPEYNIAHVRSGQTLASGRRVAFLALRSWAFGADSLATLSRLWAHKEAIRMSKSSSSSDLQETAGFFGGLIRQARLAWRLLRDGRVPSWVKVIPVIGLVYLVSPIDLLPDWVLPGLGQMDDIALILLALKMFVDLSPPGVVGEHMHDLSGAGRTERAANTHDGPTIDATYSLLDEVPPNPDGRTENR